MKKLFSVLAIAGACMASQAQVSDTRPMWGVQAAFDINIPGSWHGDAGSVEMYRQGYGGTVGIIYNVYLGRNFYLEPGVSLFYDKYSYKDLTLSNIDGKDINDPSLYKAGIRIPLVVGYQIPFSGAFAMNVFTGPEFNYAFAGAVNVKDKGAIDGTDISLFGENGHQHRADLAWRVGFGLPYGNWCVTVEGAFGVTDLLKTGMSFRENRVSVGLSYYF